MSTSEDSVRRFFGLPPRGEQDEDEEPQDPISGLFDPSVDSLIQAAPEAPADSTSDEQPEGEGPGLAGRLMTAAGEQFRQTVELGREWLGMQEEPVRGAPGAAGDLATALRAGGEAVGGFSLDQLTDRTRRMQAQGRRLEAARERGEPVPGMLERIFQVPQVQDYGATYEAIQAEERIRGRDIQRGVARGGVGRSVALGSGALKAANPPVEFIMDKLHAPVPGALEESAEFLQRRKAEALHEIGETQTGGGTIAEVMTGLGIELGAFMAGGAGVRSITARAATSSRAPAGLSRALARISEPRTLFARMAEDLAAGGPIDYLIAASGPENASVTFLAELATKPKVREGLAARGFDPDQVERQLREIAQDTEKRALFEAGLGWMLAAPIQVGLQAASRRAGRGVLDEFTDVGAASRRAEAARAEPPGETPRASEAAEEAPEEPAPRPDEPEGAAREAEETAEETTAADEGPARDDEPFQITQAAFKIGEGEDADIFPTGAVHDLDQIEDPVRRQILMDAVAEGEAEAGFITNRTDPETGQPEFLGRDQAERVSGAEVGEASVIAGTEAGAPLRQRAKVERQSPDVGPRFTYVEEDGTYRIFDSEADAVDERWPAFDTEDEARDAARRLNEQAEKEARLGAEVEAERAAAEEVPAAADTELPEIEEVVRVEGGEEVGRAYRVRDHEGEVHEFDTLDRAEAFRETVRPTEEGGAPEAAEAAAREAETPERQPQEPVEAGEEVDAAPERRVEELGAREVGSEVQGVSGRHVRVKNADGSEVLTQYQVVEARAIRTSHDPGNFAPRSDYPENTQGRGYHREPDAQEFVITRSQGDELDTSILLDPTARPLDGPTIITADGVALGGNARGMIVKRAYDLHPETSGARYRQALMERADEFGIDRAEIEGMDNPVLVRKVVDPGVDQADRRTLAELVSKFNDQPTRSRDPLGEAATRARRFLENGSALDHYARTIGSSDTLRAYLRTKDGRTWLRMLQDEGTISPEAMTRFRNADGSVTDEGKTALERMLFGAVVDDPDVFARAPKSHLRDLTHAVPALVKASDVPGFDLGPQIREVLDYLHGYRESNLTDFDEYLAQQGLFGDADQKTKELAAFLVEENRATIKKGFRKYAQDAMEHRRQDDAAGDLFDAEPVTNDEAFQKRFVERVYEPQIPGLRGNADLGEAGFAAPEVLRAIQRSSVGAIFGASVGSLFGETPEAKRRNAALFGFAGAGAPWAMDFAVKRLAPAVWNVTSRTAQQVSDAIKKGGPTVPDDPHLIATFRREAYRKIWRSRLPIDEMTERAAGKTRGEIPAQENPALLATVNSGSVSHADQTYNLGVHKPGTTNYRTRRGLRAVLKEVGHRMDDLRWYGVARRIVEDLEPRGLYEEAAEEATDQIGMATRDATPITPEEARAILEDYGRTYKEGTAEVVEEGDEQLAGWFEEVQEIDDAWWVLLEEEGVLAAGAAARIRTENPNYWPFLRDVPPESKAPGAGGSKFTTASPTMQLRGSELPILDPIESLVIQQYFYSDLIFRQRILGGLQGLVEIDPENPFMRRLDPGEISERIRFRGQQLEGQVEDNIVAELEDETLEAWIPRRVSDDDPIIRVRHPEGGIAYYELSSDMMDAARALSARSLPVWMKMLKAPARWLRTGVTVMPEFQVANLVRDVFFSAVTDPSLGARPGGSVARHAIAAPKALAQSGESALRAIARLLGDALGEEGDELVELWRSAGGPFGAFQELDRNVLESRLRQLQREGGSIDNVTDPIGALRAFGDRIRGITIAIENGPRLGRFVREVEEGGPDINTAIRAAAESRDQTVDFSLRGASEAVQNLAHLSGFWMARMSGLDKIRRAWLENPKKFVGTALGSITMFSVLNYARNRNDPGYWQIPTYVRNFYWVVKLPEFMQSSADDLPEWLTSDPESSPVGTVVKPIPEAEGGTWLRIPKPHEPGWLFGSVPERFLEWIDPANPYKTADERGLEFMKERGKELSQFFQELLPIPTAALPFIENFFNHDLFMGRGVISPYEEASGKADRLKGREYASEFGKSIGDVMDVPPSMVDNVMTDVFGTAGRLSLEMIDDLGRPAHEGAAPAEPVAQQMPQRVVIGRFVSEEGSYSPESVDRFYRRWQDANGAFSSYREWFRKAVQRSVRERRAGKDVSVRELPEVVRSQQIQRDNLSLLLKRDVYNDIANRLRMLRERRESIDKDTQFGPEEKRALKRQVDRKMGFLTSLATFDPEHRDQLFDRYEVPEDYQVLREALQQAEETEEKVRQAMREEPQGRAAQ